MRMDRLDGAPTNPVRSPRASIKVRWAVRLAQLPVSSSIDEMAYRAGAVRKVTGQCDALQARERGLEVKT